MTRWKLLFVVGLGLAGIAVGALWQTGRPVAPPATTPVAERATRVLEAYVERGTAHVRTHVDVDVDAGLSGLEGVLQARERLRGRLDVQVVAFPQGGLVVRPGTVELLEHAVVAGAELVGGLDPAGFDGDANGHLDAVFGIAERHGCGVDIHLHDGGEAGRALAPARDL